jgi:hypothetical protein
MSYNGWKNYETWCVSLWLDNDQGNYYAVRELLNDDDPHEPGDPAPDLAGRIEAFVDDLAEMTCPGSREGASFVSDLLGAALSEVDWDEIAENLLSETADA